MLRTAVKSRPRRNALATVLAAVLLLIAPLVRADDGEAVTLAAGGDKDLLVGIGIVVGLPGTGDSTIDPAVIDASIIGVLKRAGLEPWRDQIAPGRVAVVMLSAALPEAPGDGARIDVSISAIGDARSISGGKLLVTPLRDAEGIVHAVGKGMIAAGLDSRGAVLRTGELAQGAVIHRQGAGDDYAALTP